MRQDRRPGTLGRPARQQPDEAYGGLSGTKRGYGSRPARPVSAVARPAGTWLRGSGWNIRSVGRYSAGGLPGTRPRTLATPGV